MIRKKHGKKIYTEGHRDTEVTEKMKTKTKKKLPAESRTKRVRRIGSWEEFFRVRDEAIKADPGAFEGFMGDRKNDARQTEITEKMKRKKEKVCTESELAKALAKARLSDDGAEAWRRDLRAARKMLKAPVDKWHGKG
jgi:hypothetical protein